MLERHPDRAYPVLALTGGICSGKSTVAAFFRRHGTLVLSADQVARELLEPGQPGWRALRDAFGDRFLDSEGRVARPTLRRAIFGDTGLRQKVDALLHPLIRKRIGELVAAVGPADWPQPSRLPPLQAIVVETPLLFEAGWEGDFDCVVVVASNEEQALERLTARDGVTRAEAVAALAAQMPMTEKTARADYVIDNRGGVTGTERQVAKLIERLTEKLQHLADCDCYASRPLTS